MTAWTQAVIGTLLLVGVSTLAQRRPPNYSQDRMPVTSFSCRDKIIGGYYADPETDCQMFHVCVKVPGQGVQDYKFLCPNDTSFDQENQICDDWFNIDCEASTLYYSDNFDLYRIGSDFPGSKQERLPSNNINNAVSEIDDDFYLQKSDQGDNSGSDLLRGSHSSNFYSNKNRGREDDEDDKEDLKKKTTKNNSVRKLLTGKRPVATTAAPVDNYSTSPQYQPRYNNNNFAGRVSQFRGHARNQPSTTEAPTTLPTRQTEAYNRQAYNQRNFYSPTTPKLETTPAPQRTDFYRNYNNPTTKRNYYENTQNYNYQTTAFAQTTRNYQNQRITTTTQPTTVFVDTTPSREVKNYYETQNLYKVNSGVYNQQYEDSKDKDEFLKTAPSQNLGASAFNSLQNSYKSFNTSVSATYNFIPSTKQVTNNQQPQTYYNPSTQAPNYYTQTTQKPFQQQNYYTTPKVQPSQQTYQQNNYNPSTQTSSSTPKVVPQYTPTTIRPYNQQAYTQSTATPFVQYNPTTIKPFQQQYNQQTKKPFQKQYNNAAQQTYQTQSTPRNQPTATFQAQKSTAAPQSYNQPQQFQPQRNPAQYQQTSNYYTPTTISSRTQGFPDATERPRPFTQDVKKEEKKEKEQYDYAYYDDGTQSEYDSIEPVEEFKRTKSKN